MSKENIRSVMGDGVDCENKPAAWYDDVSIDYYYEDSVNGTNEENSLNTVLINFLVPDHYVATLNVSEFKVDDWGHLSIYPKEGASHKLLHLGLEEGVDGSPGERGGHTEWGKTGSVQLIPGEYVIEVAQKNATYNDKGNPRYNVSKCTLALHAEKVEALCEIAWPQSPIPLLNPITWYEKRRDSNGVEYKYDTGTISEISVTEFAAMARVIYSEAGTTGAEMKAIASVMLNRLGNSAGGTDYRKPVLSMLDEFNRRDSSGKNPIWASVTDAQYASVEGDKCYTIDTQSCAKLKASILALFDEIVSGPSYPYDGLRTAGTTSQSHVTIGGTAFLTERQYAICDVKPSNWDSIDIWQGSPLDI